MLWPNLVGIWYLHSQLTAGGPFGLWCRLFETPITNLRELFLPLCQVSGPSTKGTHTGHTYILSIVISTLLAAVMTNVYQKRTNERRNEVSIYPQFEKWVYVQKTWTRLLYINPLFKLWVYVQKTWKHVW